MERLDIELLRLYPEMTRSRLAGLVKAGFVKVNGEVVEKAGLKIAPDKDIIEVEFPPPVPANPEPEDIPLSIVYEDEHIIVIDKPAGMVVHPAPGHATGTLVNALLAHAPQIANLGCRERPGIVHRLDQETSGLIIVAKTEKAMQNLAKAFASHRDIEKIYLAICHGRPTLESGRIETLLARHPVERKRYAIVDKNGKLAITNWRLAKRLSCGLSLIECKIETGRTHQIRVHLSSMRCPIIGDKMYGKGALDRQLKPIPERQMLHAWKLSLWHPIESRRLEFISPIPDDMSSYISSEI